MTGEPTPEELEGASGRLGEQVKAMEREFDRMRAGGEEVPPLALEMLSRLRALASALDDLQSSFDTPPPDAK